MTNRILATLVAASILASLVGAQTPVSSAAITVPAGAGVEGRWEGAIGAGPNRLRIVLEITKSADGLLLGVLRSLDQGGGPIPVERVTEKADSLRVDIPVIGGRYDAVLSADRTQLNGTFTQGGPRPLVMTRTAAASSAPATPTPAPVSPFGLMVEVDVPVRPTPVTGAGKRHLIYELHLTNFAGGELLLTKVEALGHDGVLASYEGAPLNAILMQPRLGTMDNRSLTAAGRAIAFIQVTLDSGVAVPASVRHRITAGTQSLETAEMPIGTTAVVIGAPFSGSDWRAANGPSNTSGHRRALIPIGGKPAIAQRFAIDWVQVNPAGATFIGNQLDNKSYRAYGVEILAVADGIVSAVKDGIPENIPGMNSRAVPINLETIGGNHIVQDIGSGRYAFYAHLQPGSLRVKAGQRVKKGQVIGLLGNSGNSTEPHLHFHIMDGTSPLGSEGLPYVIDAWELQTTPGRWERRTNQLPMMNMMVRFPAPPAER